MRYLPEHIAKTLESDPVERYRLEYFYEQHVVKRFVYHGFGHFVLACYAALPPVLTPDLLYKIWLNFRTYFNREADAAIHSVAPADILLSPLVEEIGFECYQMPEPIRNALLSYWDQCVKGIIENTFRLFPVQTVAEFLLDYSRHDNSPDNFSEKSWREAQEWTAESYLNPVGAMQRVQRQLDQSDQATTTVNQRSRYEDAMQKMLDRVVGHNIAYNLYAFTDTEGLKLLSRQQLDLKRHFSVCTVAYDQSGTRIVSCSSSNTIRIWDAVTRKCIRKLDGHTDGVNAVRFIHGQIIASCSDDHTIRIWNAQTGETIHLLQSHTAAVTRIDSCADGSHLVSVSNDKSIKVWDTNTGEVLVTLHTYKESGAVVAISPDGKHVATANDDALVVWDWRTEKIIRTLQGHEGRITRLGFGSSGKHLVSAAEDQSIRFWDFSPGSSLLKIQASDARINSITLNADENRLLSATSDGNIYIWQLQNGDLVQSFNLGVGPLNHAVFHADGKSILVACEDGVIRQVDAEKAAVTAIFKDDIYDKISDQPSKEKNVISLRIPDSLKVSLGENNAPLPPRAPKTWALVAGQLGAHDLESAPVDPEEDIDAYTDAFDFAACLEAYHPEELLDLRIMVRKQASKEAILERLKNIAAQSQAEDQVIVYFSSYGVYENGHCYMRCGDSGSTLDTYLKDEDFRAAAREINCARLTLVLEIPYAASPHWVDLGKGHVLFASCSVDQITSLSRGKIEGRKRSPFTYALVKNLERKAKVSNFCLYLDTMGAFEMLDDVKSTYGDKLWALHRPQLYASPETLHTPFFYNTKPLPQLQSLLQQSGHYDGDIDGIWEEKTAKALGNMTQVQKLATDLNKQDYINILEKKLTQAVADNRPVFLFVFSDPDNQYPELAKNCALIEQLSKYIRASVETVLLSDAGIDQLQHMFTAPEWRNRIALFCYSGESDPYNLIVGSGKVACFDVLRWLRFQRRLRWAVFNGTNTHYFGEMFSLLGAQVAIALSGKQNDTLLALGNLLRREPSLQDSSFEHLAQKLADLFQSIAQDGENLKTL